MSVTQEGLPRGTAADVRSVAGEPGVAEHLQPVGMGAAAEQFRRTLAHPLWPLAPQEAAVVEEELQQGQVIRSQVAAEDAMAQDWRTAGAETRIPRSTTRPSATSPRSSGWTPRTLCCTACAVSPTRKWVPRKRRKRTLPRPRNLGGGREDALLRRPSELAKHQGVGVNGSASTLDT